MAARFAAARLAVRVRAGARASGTRTAAAAAAPPPPPKKCLLLTYTYVPDVLERRGPFREAHLAGAAAQVAAGKMLIAGAFTDPTDGAAFVFTPQATKASVAAFVAADPYVVAGLVTSHSIREWAVPVLAPAVDAVL